ncbi:MAG: glycosyltransferase family 4 protein [Candidatus Pacearchaeota archaeon]
MKKLKILELCHFSAGSCGVWQRVKQESQLLSRNHQVKVFSSNAVKDSDEIAKTPDKIGDVEIRRFPFIKIAGESGMYWNYKKVALDYKPDIIIAHVYRHLHTTTALKIAKKIHCKVFLVTHAPFVPGDSTRSFVSKYLVRFYDRFVASRKINQFDKIIAISKWEVPYLLEIGAKEEKIVYIPNGIPDEFFTQSQSKEENKILFLGRISPIKNLEVLIKAMPYIDKQYNLEIVGPADENYLKELKLLVKQNQLSNVKFSPSIWDLKNKIRKVDSCKIFVLPSKREAMPQALIEAMARGKIPVATDCEGTRDLIENGKNGFLFENNNSKDLADKINLALKSNRQANINAKKSVERFKWSLVIKTLEGLFV